MILIDQYAYINRLSHVHPFEKITFSLFFLLFSIITKDVCISLITFIVMSAFILYAAKIPFSIYCKLLLLPVFFLLTSITSIILSFTTTKPLLEYYAIWQISSLYIFIGKTSIVTAYHLFFSVLASISCLYFLTLTTPISAITYTMRCLKMPLIFIELCELTYRFIFVFLASIQQIYEAQQSRLGYQRNTLWLNSVALLITALFRDVFWRSQKLNEAMISRCYNEEISNNYVTYTFNKRNWIVIVSSMIGIVAIYIGGKLI